MVIDDSQFEVQSSAHKGETEVSKAVYCPPIFRPTISNKRGKSC